MENCIKFKGKNLPCKKIEFDNFNDPEKFDGVKFNDSISRIYGDDAFEQDSPFVFPKNYVSSKENREDLKQQQKFVASYINYHTNVNGCLIYHGLGSGKTCTSIIIGEAMKAYYHWDMTTDREGKKHPIILVSTPAQVIPSYKKELLGLCPSRLTIKGKEQNYRNGLSETAINMNPENQAAIDRKIEKFWHIMSHDSMINDMSKDEDKSVYLTTMKKEGSIIIIDEIHKLISATGKSYRTLINKISYHMHPNNKLIIMSATPIYDKPYEIGLTMNLFRPRLHFPNNEMEFNKLFVDQEKNKLINESLFKWMCTGYVSYFGGGNPRLYPFTRNITIHHPLIENTRQFEGYVKALLTDIPSNQENKDITDKDVSSFFSRSQMCSNIFFEELTVSSKGKQQQSNTPLNEFRKNLVNVSKGRLHDEKIEAVLDYVKKNYSVKYSSVVRQILSSTGTVFLFSKYLDSGVKAIAVILDVLDFIKFDPLEEGRAIKATTPKNRYVLWTGEIVGQKKEIFSNKVIGLFNSDQNIDGKFIKIIMGTEAISEGVSLHNVRNVHILTPWWNDSRMKQIQGRAIRLQSHKNLREKERYVNVYTHISTLPTFPAELDVKKLTNKLKLSDNSKLKLGAAKKMGLTTKSIEMYIMEKSYAKKRNSRSFEYLLKQSAVDCKLNEYGNIQRLNEIIEPYYNGEIKEYVAHYENYSTGDIYVKDPYKLETYTTDDKFPVGVLFDDKKEFKLYIAKKDPPNSLNFKLIINKEPSMEYVPGNVSTITHDLITYENINCKERDNPDFKSYDFSGNKDLVNQLLTVSQNTKIIYQFEKNEEDILNCVRKYLESIQDNEKETDMANQKIHKLISSNEGYIKTIELYIKANSHNLGDYFTVARILVIIKDDILNGSNPKKLEKVIKDSEKSFEELVSIFDNISEFVSLNLQS